MDERSLQNVVIELAQMLKWRVAHFRPAMNARGEWRTPVQADGKGFVDLVLVRDRVLYRELKSARGTLSVEQQDWIRALRLAGQDVDVWHPADWLNGTIERCLRQPGHDHR